MEIFLVMVLVIAAFIVGVFDGSQDFIPTVTEVQLLEILEECEATLPRDKSCKLIAVVDEE